MIKEQAIIKALDDFNFVQSTDDKFFSTSLNFKRFTGWVCFIVFASIIFVNSSILAWIFSTSALMPISSSFLVFWSRNFWNSLLLFFSFEKWPPLPLTTEFFALTSISLSMFLLQSPTSILSKDWSVRRWKPWYKLGTSSFDEFV